MLLHPLLTPPLKRSSSAIQKILNVVLQQQGVRLRRVATVDIAITIQQKLLEVPCDVADAHGRPRDELGRDQVVLRRATAGAHELEHGVHANAIDGALVEERKLWLVAIPRANVLQAVQDLLLSRARLLVCELRAWETKDLQTLAVVSFVQLVVLVVILHGHASERRHVAHDHDLSLVRGEILFSSVQQREGEIIERPAHPLVHACDI